jgi:hypothetical protein
MLGWFFTLETVVNTGPGLINIYSMYFLIETTPIRLENIKTNTPKISITSRWSVIHNSRSI